ncbi:hypothetical protein Clacol_008362 [Clathrus columnatus]|uniref:Metallo-beta-lactamase domain-containing protein n=1 Tax=Clathrus columnatus TaxID=1419009 RepID=A0AAV5AMN4_9AGAM|nr:hypothetical protein Clacol_008362 [Clathrus columnatus]
MSSTLLTDFSVKRSVLLALAVGTTYFLTKFIYSVIKPYWSPLRALPGPKSKSLLWGHLQDIFKSGPAEAHLKWTYEYGFTFVYKGFLNRDRLTTLDPKALTYILNHSYDFPKPEEVRANLAELLGEGFDYKFEALNPAGIPNELNAAFSSVMREGGNFRLINVLRNFIPILRKIIPPLKPTSRTRRLAKSTEVMTRIGSELLSSKKQAVQSIIDQKEHNPGQVEKTDISGRDLLSRLVAANMATDLPENHRLSDHDVYSQIPTFLIAGHETTATAATWTLFALAQHPDIQIKLREELLLVETDSPSMDELNALPYLELIVREIMRLHAPVASTIRLSAKDDLIPLENPYQDKNGILRHEIPISKGDSIFIPILTLNLHKGIWGEDALEFRPERWANYSDKSHDLPGVYANMLTFLGGPRSFQFELAVPVEDVEKKTALVTRPHLKSAPKAGPQLPLKIRAWKLRRSNHRDRDVVWSPPEEWQHSSSFFSSLLNMDTFKLAVISVIVNKVDSPDKNIEEVQEQTTNNRPSHHVNDTQNHFKNPWPSFRHVFSPNFFLFRWPGRAEYRNANSYMCRPSVPANASSLIPQQKPNWGTAAPPETLKATWLGHASFLVELPTPVGASRGPRILLDPVFSHRCSPLSWIGPARFMPTPCTLEELPQVDVVAISHNHYDHMDTTTIQALAFSKTGHNNPGVPRIHIFAPLNNEAPFKSIGIPQTHIHCLDWWQSSDIIVELPSKVSSNITDELPPIRTTFRLTCTPTQHLSGRSVFLTDRWKSLWSSWAVESNPYNKDQSEGGMHPVKLWFAGDTGYRTVHVGENESDVPVCPAFKQIGDKFGGFDLALLPIGAYNPRPLLSYMHCAPQDSVRLFADLKAKKAIAMHWGTWHLGGEPFDEPVALLKQEREKAGLKSGEFEPCAIGETIVV